MILSSNPSALPDDSHVMMLSDFGNTSIKRSDFHNDFDPSTVVPVPLINDKSIERGKSGSTEPSSIQISSNVTLSVSDVFSIILRAQMYVLSGLNGR